MYDAIIVGAGPAGLSTALSVWLHSVRRDYYPEILVIDKEKNPGEKKPCGGMICKMALNIFPSLEKFSSKKIRQVRILYRNRRFTVNFDDVVAINIDRHILARFLMQKIAKLGTVELNLGESIQRVNASSDGVTVYSNDKIYRGKILVGADGVFSIIRKEIFGYSYDLDELGVAYQVRLRLSRNTIDELFGDANEFYYGKEFSPAGYAWIFPHRDHIRIGVGAIASKIRGYDLRTYVRKLIMKYNLQNEKIIKEEAYLVPLSGGSKRITAHRVLLVGDAAHQVAPLSGAGIHLAIIAGLLAGEIISRCLIKRRRLSYSLKQYERIWNCLYGIELRWQRRLVNFLLKRGSKVAMDKKINNLIRKFAELLLGLTSTYDLIKSWIYTQFLKIIRGY